MVKRETSLAGRLDEIEPGGLAYYAAEALAGGTLDFVRFLDQVWNDVQRLDKRLNGLEERLDTLQQTVENAVKVASSLLDALSAAESRD